MVTYTSSQGLRRYTDERRVLEASKGAVAPGVSVYWTPQTGLQLPALPPSSFTPDSCKIIHIDYRIEVKYFKT